MTTKEHMAEDIRRITYLVGLIRDGGDPDCYLTGRMLRIAFDALSTACTYKGIFPDGWLEVLYPSATLVGEPAGFVAGIHAMADHHGESLVDGEEVDDAS